MPVPFSELAVPPGTKLIVHSVAERAEPNWFVEAVHAPRSVYQPKKVRIQAVIAGSGTDAADVMYHCLLNGKSLETRRSTCPPTDELQSSSTCLTRRTA